MREFTYAKPADETAALQALAAPGTVAIAGGTELLNWMRLGIAAPERLVDITALPRRRGIVKDGNWLVLGALTTLSEIIDDALVATHAAVLGSACAQSASAQIRNRATLGGNVMQRTRCSYFRSEDPVPWPCNKREPGSGCSAITGANDQHAIFGWTDECVAVHPSDPVVALACLDAEAMIVTHRHGTTSERWSPVETLLLTQEESRTRGQGSATTEHQLEPDELIAAYRIPIRDRSKSAYVKVRERASYAYALVSAAAAVETAADGTATTVRLALGSVAQRPWRLHRAEAALRGKELTVETVTAAVADAMTDARPLSDNAYKISMATEAAVRAVMEAHRA